LWHFAHTQNIPTENLLPQKEARIQLQDILSKILFDYARNQFNTVISGAMKILNLLQTCDNHLKQEGLGILLKLLFPITPHICAELWQKFYPDAGDIEKAGFPIVDTTALVSDTQKIIVQINGKLRGIIMAPVHADKLLLQEIINKDESLQKYFTGKIIHKIIVVPHKLVNYVVSENTA